MTTATSYVDEEKILRKKTWQVSGQNQTSVTGYSQTILDLYSGLATNL